MGSTEITKPLLYVVDDDSELRVALHEYLTAHGFEVIGMPSADVLLRRLRQQNPDLVILDVMMPGTGGLQALRNLRHSGNEVPVLMLTARSDTEDCIIGLTIGADDYLGKPFIMEELRARVQNVLRRCRSHGPYHRNPRSQEPIRFGSFVVDPRERKLTRDGVGIHVAVADFALLRVMASHPYRHLTRERLLELTGARITDKGIRSIDVKVLRLRRLIESDPANPMILQTVRGLGYSFVPP